MLILYRYAGEIIRIHPNILIHTLQIMEDQQMVKLGIEAPRDIIISRFEKPYKPKMPNSFPMGPL